MVVRRMREAAIEPTVVPRTRSTCSPSRSSRWRRPRRSWRWRSCGSERARTHSYAELPCRQLEGVLDMVDGRYPSAEFGELRPRIVWDRLAGTVRPRKGARALAGRRWHDPRPRAATCDAPGRTAGGRARRGDGLRARPGQVFLPGASAWRIEEIGRDRVTVTPAPGAPERCRSEGRTGWVVRKALGGPPGVARWAWSKPHRDAARASTTLTPGWCVTGGSICASSSDATGCAERLDGGGGCFRDEVGDWRSWASVRGARARGGASRWRRVPRAPGVGGRSIWSTRDRACTCPRPTVARRARGG